MQFDDVVRKRRMVRNFTDEPVPQETVERMISTAQRGPSAGFSQGVSFVVVTDPEQRQRLARAVHEEQYTSGDLAFDSFISRAPVQVVVCTSEKIYKDRYREPDKLGPNGEEIEWPVPFWHTDAGAALMLLLLAAVDEGLAGAFVGIPVPTQQAVRELLGVPDHFGMVGIALIGHGAPDVKSPSLKRGRRRLEDVLHWQRW
jgi:nitroreductase